MAFAVLDEQNQTWLYHLASMSAGGALAEYLTSLQVLKVWVYDSTAMPCFGDDEFLKPGIEL